MVGSVCAYVGYPESRSLPSSSCEISHIGSDSLSSPEEDSHEDKGMVQESAGEQERVTRHTDSPVCDPESNSDSCLSSDTVGTAEIVQIQPSSELVPGRGTVGGSTIARDVILEQLQAPGDDVAQSHARDYTLKHSARMMLESAYDDRTFLMLCLLFDESLDTKFDSFADMFLENYKGCHPNLSPVVMDLLVFCHWKHFGIKDEKEHEDRE